MSDVLNPPALEEISEARQLISGHLPITPLYPSPALSRVAGFNVWVKYENHLPTGSFKPRGAMYQLEVLRRQGIEGVVTASTGNHGLGITFAAQALRMRAVIVIPEGTDAMKVNKLNALGAEVRTVGKDLLESCDHSREIAEREGLSFIEDGEAAGLMAGAATLTMELMEQHPNIEAVFVPVGGGNLIGSVCRAVELARPDVKVIGVQSEAAPAAFLSWEQKEWILSDFCETFAGGLATSYPGKFAYSVYVPRVDDFVLVSENDLKSAITGMLDATGFVAEGAAAAPLAACLKYPGRWKFGEACFLFTGGNLARETLADILTESQDGDG